VLELLRLEAGAMWSSAGVHAKRWRWSMWSWAKRGVLAVEHS
jgi:hypothetical protein